MKRVPRQQLHTDFVRAVRASGHSLVTLATLADYPAYTHLAPFLNRRPVPVTALHAERMRALAVIVGYDGPLFKEPSQ